MAGKGTRGRNAGTSGSGTTPRRTRARAARAPRATETADAAEPAEADDEAPAAPGSEHEIRVRRMHRRDANRVWEFLKLVFRAVNKQTVEYQRPRSKQRFLEQYDDEGIEQLIFEIDGQIVGYAECAYEVTGSDNWVNPRYFDKRDMRPLFVEELAQAVRDAGGEDVPATARDVVSARVDRLRAKARTALRFAAVLGGRVRPHLLEELLGEGNLDAEIDELIAAGFLVRADGRAGAELGYAPKVPLAVGIDRYCQWLRRR